MVSIGLFLSESGGFLSYTVRWIEALNNWELRRKKHTQGYYSYITFIHNSFLGKVSITPPK